MPLLQFVDVAGWRLLLRSMSDKQRPCCEALQRFMPGGLQAAPPLCTRQSNSLLQTAQTFQELGLARVISKRNSCFIIGAFPHSKDLPQLQLNTVLGF